MRPSYWLLDHRQLGGVPKCTQSFSSGRVGPQRSLYTSITFSHPGHRKRSPKHDRRPRIGLEWTSHTPARNEPYVWIHTYAAMFYGTKIK
jgi:hypothetical protein